MSAGVEVGAAARRGRARRLVPAVMRPLRGERRVLVTAVVLAALGAVALAAPLIAPHPPNQIRVGPPLAAPSAEHPMGTDSFGRDGLSRVIAGTRISFLTGGLVVLAALGVGLPLGLLMGYRGGSVDFVFGRLLDVVFAFPSLLLGLVVAAILGPGLKSVMIALVIVYVPLVTRFVRGMVIAERHREYVLAVHVAGATPLRVIGRHILPNIVSPLLVIASVVMSASVLAEAALSFLGFGVQPPTASWGRMLTESAPYIYSQPWLVLFPGAAITLLVLSLNLLGDGLRDYFDPRQRDAAPLPPVTS